MSDLGPEFEPAAELLQHLPFGVHLVDQRGFIRWANRRELQDLGYDPGQYFDRPVSDIHVDRPVVTRILGLLGGGAEIQSYPARLRAADGSVRYALINSNVYRGPGGEFLHTRCLTTLVSRATYELRVAELEKLAGPGELGDGSCRTKPDSRP